MKSIIRKFKKLDKKYKVLFFVFGLIFLLSIVYITESLLLLKKIETFIRIIVLIFIYISYFFFLFFSILLLFSKKHKLYIVNSIFVLLISILFIVLSVYINKTYNIVDSMNKKMVTYSSSLVVLNDTEFVNNKDFIIGMINDEKDIEGYVLANKLIDKKKLDKVEIKYYDNYLEMIGDLYNKSIHGVLISSNYTIKYSVYENYENIKNETKVIYSYKEKMKNQDILLSSNKSLTEPFTVLLLGVDSEIDGLSSTQVFNGDTMMLITFNPNTLNATIFSIPRDTYVPIACNGNKSSKINSSAIGGTSCVINTIKNLTDINIDYYVKINFKGVVDLVNVLDGVTVDVPIDFCEQDSNREEDVPICLTKGEKVLNGEEALALSRHRHSLPLGDFQRVQHQQLVVEAIANKVKSIRSVNKFYDILNAISKNIETNVETDEMLNLYNVGKKMLSQNNSSINIEKTYLTGYDLTMLIPGLGNVYTFQYYEESLNEIVKAMKINLELEEPEMVKTFNFSVNYTYETPVIGKQYYSVKRNEALPNFIGSNINYLNSWADARNINVDINYITEGMDGYDENNNNIIINQNVQVGTLVSSIDSISVNVIKVSPKEKTSDNEQEKVIEDKNTLNKETKTKKEKKETTDNDKKNDSKEETDDNKKNIDEEEKKESNDVIENSVEDIINVDTNSNKNTD